MKAKLIGAALLAAALAACGGKASFSLGGSIVGLNNQGLVLQNNGNETLTVAAGSSSFAFPHSISYGTEYHITIKTQPDHMTCSVANPIGSAGHTTTINVVISCTQNSYSLSGVVKNLLNEGLVIVNGSSSGPISIAKPASGSDATFGISNIPVGDSYGLSVLTQPAPQVCSIANGTGVMGDANRSNVVITCQ